MTKHLFEDKTAEQLNQFFLDNHDEYTEDHREVIKMLLNRLKNINKAWNRRLPYKDESGIFSVTLQDAAIITDELYDLFLEVKSDD